MSNETPITVYFESNSHAEVAARFADETIYAQCFPALKQYAKEARMHITDSVDMNPEAPLDSEDMAIHILNTYESIKEGYSYFTMKKGRCYYAIIFSRKGLHVGSYTFSSEEDAGSYACGYIEGHKQANRKD